MRIPSYYRQPGWQRFIAGMAIGAIISWFIFLYIYGVWQEEYSKDIKKLRDDIEELEEDKQIWQEEYKELNKKNIERLTVQEIKVEISNGEKYRLDPLSVFEAEKKVKEDIKMMLAKDLETVYKSRELLKRVIENKPVRINEKRYNIKVEEVFIYTTLYIQLRLTLEE
ncbi:sporulation protein [Bacillus canaveralius]|uniref:Sporulation protein n=1 Tax=Bacillus canaveralius TaxID=1403243 RepID=A0A2N5GFH6_9BACI|nr:MULTISPECIES: sporulation membrane protein YtrI [Bacillus]PLR79509.1 sporulation protein [Bacillus canaveralius]PLR82335.1 sporulation protein [Bacillus sp. V33-4]PLR95163.1 sporulation protein [Bacillus canaveralius]RSK55857.1 sporulation protein [Bacillus canaveralius]